MNAIDSRMFKVYYRGKKKPSMEIKIWIMSFWWYYSTQVYCIYDCVWNLKKCLYKWWLVTLDLTTGLLH